MKAYSLDLRERVLAAVEAGTPHAEIVRTLRVSLATVGRYVRLRRAGDSLVGKRHLGMRARIGKPERAALEAQLAAAGTDDLARIKRTSGCATSRKHNRYGNNAKQVRQEI